MRIHYDPKGKLSKWIFTIAIGCVHLIKTTEDLPDA